MTKLLIEIEIEDVNDPYQCAEVLKQIFATLREYHSDEAFSAVLIKHALCGMTEDEWQAEQRFSKACSKFSLDEQRLVLEYCAMDKPSKLGLAKVLAQRNRSLPAAERYFRGSTSETTMLQQIKRVLKKGSPEDIATIATGSPWLRAEYLRHSAAASKFVKLAAEEKPGIKKRRRG
jgi:hypothetical protein